MGKVIGIDLGTTNSCVAVVENDEPVIIPSASGARTTPSVVAFTKVGERLVGETAKRQAVTNPDRTFVSIKRKMGSDWSVKIDGSVYKPQTISAMILMQLKKDAEDYLGEPVTDAVITVPAYYNDMQRQATKDAGKIAGLNVRRIINEPTSAALSYGLNHGAPQKILVYDLGGGTFDVSVIEIGDGVLEVLATNGNNHLGGDDFDARVTDWIVRTFQEKEHIDLRKDFAAMQRVKEAAEQAKKELSTLASTEINLPYITQHHGQPVHLELTLTRETFVGLIRDLIEQTEIPVRNALSDAGIAPRDLGKVLLVGGSTRVPAVQDKIRSLTGIEPSQNINPDECVAVGAAVMGSTLSGNALVAKDTGSSLVLFDVTPMSLAIETVGGVSTVLIPRNTTIPTRYSKTFYAATPYQKSVRIKVLQGERPMARDNKLIGQFNLFGIKRAANGIPQIDVTFDIDANGILTVSAQDQVTGKSNSVKITADDRMSDAEIEQAMKDAAEYASYDSLRREALDLNTECQTLLAQTNTALKNAGKNIDKTLKKQVTRDERELTKQLSRLHVDRVTNEELQTIRAAKDALAQSAAGLPH